MQVTTTNRFRTLEQAPDCEQFVYRKRRLETNTTDTEQEPDHA
jgi:hypothetical protein